MSRTLTGWSFWGTRGSRGTEAPARQPGTHVNPLQRAGPIRVRAEIPSATRKRPFLNHAETIIKGAPKRLGIMDDPQIVLFLDRHTDGTVPSRRPCRDSFGHDPPPSVARGRRSWPFCLVMSASSCPPKSVTVRRFPEGRGSATDQLRRPCSGRNTPRRTVPGRLHRRVQPEALILELTPVTDKEEKLKEITAGARMHRPEMLLGELRNLGVSLPLDLARRMRRFDWTTDLRYETRDVGIRERQPPS